MNSYLVKYSPNDSPCTGTWDSTFWQIANILTIDNFRPESSDHQPIVLVKALHTPSAIHGIFKVNDRFVRSTHSGYQSEVWKDSCVEWFVQPKTDKGYFNFEVNCGGSLHVSYVEDPARVDKKLRKSTPLPVEIGQKIKIFHSLPEIVEPEIAEPVEWIVEIAVPLSVLEQFVGPIGDLAGQRWRANFNKCADECSHPHWATWNPVSELNFHRPWEFGEMRFES